MKPLVVVTPIPEEMASLRRRIAPAPLPITLKRLGLPWIAVGSLADHPLVLAVTGDGWQRSGERLARLLTATPTRGVIAAGVAGGLSPELAVGDLVAIREVIEEVSGERHSIEPDLLELAEASGALPAVAVSCHELAATVARKRRLREVHAPTDRAVADLESASYAGAAAARGIPWLVLRAVSDPADEELPAWLNDCFDAAGSTDRGKVARKALLSPRSMPRLLELKHRVERLSERLADAAEAVAASWPVTGEQGR